MLLLDVLSVRVDRSRMSIGLPTAPRHARRSRSAPLAADVSIVCRGFDQLWVPRGCIESGGVCVFNQEGPCRNFQQARVDVEGVPYLHIDSYQGDWSRFNATWSYWGNRQPTTLSQVPCISLTDAVNVVLLSDGPTGLCVCTNWTFSDWPARVSWDNKVKYRWDRHDPLYPVRTAHFDKFEDTANVEF